MDLLFYLLIVGYLMFTIYTANMVEREAWPENTIRYALYGVVFIVFVMAFFASQVVLLSMLGGAESAGDLSFPEIDPIAAMLTTLFALSAGVFSLRAVNSSEMRETLSHTVFRTTAYDPNSSVHTTAILLCTTLVTGLIVFFMLGGGTVGYAENLEGTGVSVSDTLLTLILWLLAAFMGVGYTIRRYLPATLERLGLHMLTSRDVLMSIGIGLILWIVSIIFGILWEVLSNPEIFEQQTLAAERLALAIDSIGLAFLVAFAAAVGEEVFIRGALQPVFGIWVTSAFFALLHSQYLFAPSMFFIFGVSVVLGLVRERLNTTAAVVVHFVYNFVPMALIALASSQLTTS